MGLSAECATDGRLGTRFEQAGPHAVPVCQGRPVRDACDDESALRAGSNTARGVAPKPETKLA